MQASTAIHLTKQAHLPTRFHSAVTVSTHTHYVTVLSTVTQTLLLKLTTEERSQEG